jgi:rSAM/selenodomain-associated transferase 1
MTARHLVVFARAPRLGRVKRRLAGEIGTVAAWRFYRLAAPSLVRRLAGGGAWTCWLALSPDAAARAGTGPWPAGCARLPQGTGDLGRRMARVIRRLPPGPAVLVGTDIPAMRRTDIAAAFRALGTHDVVVGPARDGGYWLVGVRRRSLAERLFRGVRWSTAHALADTLANLDARHRVARLRVLEDVDDLVSFERWRHGAVAPHAGTMAVVD